MHILITGATGLIGSALTKFFLLKYYKITILTRCSYKAFNILGPKVSCLSWSTLKNRKNLNDVDIVINLAGESIVSKRWTKKQKKNLCQSRWKITLKLTELIINSKNPPKVFISASAVGFYGNQENNIITENTLPKKEFTFLLCSRWEKIALIAKSNKTRVCILRFGTILSCTKGFLKKMLTLLNLRLGIIFGNGEQYFPWIHIEDMVSAVFYILKNSHLYGIYNITSPISVKNKTFGKVLTKILKRYLLIKRIPESIIYLMMGESSSLLLNSQNVIPERLNQTNFIFNFINLEKSLCNLLKYNV